MQNFLYLTLSYKRRIILFFKLKIFSAFMFFGVFGVFCVFMFTKCKQIIKLSKQDFTLIWESTGRSPPSFRSIRLETAEKIYLVSVHHTPYIHPSRGAFPGGSGGSADPPVRIPYTPVRRFLRGEKKTSKGGRLN